MCLCPLLSSNNIPLFSLMLHLATLFRWTRNWTRWYYLQTMATVRKPPTGWQAIVRRKGHASTSKVFPKKYLAERWASQQDEMIQSMSVTPNASRATLSSILTRYLVPSPPVNVPMPRSVAVSVFWVVISGIIRWPTWGHSRSWGLSMRGWSL